MKMLKESIVYLHISYWHVLQDQVIILPFFKEKVYDLNYFIYVYLLGQSAISHGL